MAAMFTTNIKENLGKNTYLGGSSGGGFHSTNPTQSSTGGPKGKQLTNFYHFVKGLNTNIDEQTACRKYKEFTADLSQSKVGRFFDANKDREWFRSKYHPVESNETLQRQTIAFLKRLKIFNDLNERNYFDTLAFSTKNSAQILNLLDAIIVHLEDGPQELIDQLLSRDVPINQELRQEYIPDKPNSVVISDISIETTYSEIQRVCLEVNPDLLRIAHFDPYYVKGGHLCQKVVAIYKHYVDIKDVCWKLSKVKLNNKSLNACVNKCITKRIHPVDRVLNHPVSIMNDIRYAINLVLNFDEHKRLYGKRKLQLEDVVDELTSNTSDPVKVNIKRELPDDNEEAMDIVAPLSPPGSDKSIKEEEEERPFDVNSLDEDKEKEKKKSFECKFNIDLSPYRLASKLAKSKNPILDGAYVYLVDYIESLSQHQLSKVPKELLNNSQEVDDGSDRPEIDSNDRYPVIKELVENMPCSMEKSVKFLDKLLWYLRIVHSFDYYKKAMYKKEDELSLRLGVVHLREHVDDISCEIVSSDEIKARCQKTKRELDEYISSLAQKYVTKDEERFNYKSYGKVITDELTSYAQRIQKPKSSDTEEVYKCKHCTRVFQKLADIGRHFVSKHRWAVDAIELETDFFNAYLFDPTKINPSPPKELLEVQPNRFARVTNFSQMGEDPDLLQQTIEAYSKMDSFVREPAPRAQVKSDPRNDTIVDYTDISFDDAI